MGPRKIDSINWEELWQNEAQRSKLKSNPPYSWDDHAEDFQRQYSRSDYRDKLLEKAQIEPDSTVLDVGCGPGNLAVPLASRAKHVTALDKSGEMLRLGKKEADAQKISNISFIHMDWNDVVIGRDVPPHDIVICSRSFANQNPRESLIKLNRAANSRVYLTLRTSADEATAFFHNLYKEVGKEYKVYPDYLYGCNLLHQIGILAHVDFINYTDSFRYTTAEDTYRVMSSHMNITNQEQKDKMMLFITRNMTSNNGNFVLDIKVKWALLWWQK